jgi:predicted CopG family antitoxin
MVKTTVTLRDDIYAKLRQKYGPRGISEAVNEILSEQLFQEQSMFGTMKKVELGDVRDHRDHS